MLIPDSGLVIACVVDLVKVGSCFLPTGSGDRDGKQGN